MKNKINFEIIRSNRKSISIEIKPDITVLVRVPLAMKNTEIQSFLKEKENWIRIHLERAKERQMIWKEQKNGK